MEPYVVKQGDSLTKLAFTRGFDADVVWNAPENAELNARRKNKDVLCPGDLLQLPTPDPTVAAVSEGTENTYSADVPKVTINLQFTVAGSPRANAAYSVRGLPAPVESATDADGKLSVDVPILTREIEIDFTEQGTIYQVAIGDLDPHDEPSGVWMRLANLGYLGYPLAEGLDEIVTAAISAFQTNVGLPATGQPDQATMEALKDAHGH